MKKLLTREKILLIILLLIIITSSFIIFKVDIIKEMLIIKSGMSKEEVLNSYQNIENFCLQSKDCYLQDAGCCDRGGITVNKYHYSPKKFPPICLEECYSERGKLKCTNNVCEYK